MKILVTGGAGFIGSHLCESLLEKGHDVVSIDNLSTGRTANLNKVLTHPRFTNIQGDILHLDKLKRAFTGVETVFHLAAAVGVKYVIDNPLLSIHTNVLGTENVLSLANQFRCKVILASTSEVYGKNDAESLSEDSNRILGATNITRWSYASSKALDEFIAFAYHKHHSLPIVIARFFNTCGPRQSSRYGMVIPRFVKQALAAEPITVYGSGEQVRAFTYVDDAVYALQEIAFTDSCVGEVFNIGNNQAITKIMDLAQKVKEMTGSDSPIKQISYQEAYDSNFEDMMRRVPDISKIQKFVKYDPQYNLDHILAKTIVCTKESYETQRT